MYKQSVIFIVITFLLANNVLAESGIYMSATDYKNHKLSYPSDCHPHSDNRIQIDNFWGPRPVVGIHTNGEKLKLNKSDLFGYEDCKGASYRFYEGKVYQMAEVENMYIYIHVENTAQAKGFKLINHYYFSTTPDGELKPLSLSDSLLQKYLKQTAI